MELFVFIIVVTGSLSIVALAIKIDWPKAEKVLTYASLFSFFLSISSIALLVYNFRLKGVYTSSIIGSIFIISSMLLFGVTRKWRKRVMSGIITVPLFILSVLSLFNKAFLLFALILFMPFQPPFAKFKVDEIHNVEVRIGGFLACGESLTLTDNRYWLVDKQSYIGNSSCVHGINKIETLSIDKDSVEFLIYHDGKTEFDNPYNYKTSIRKNN